MYIYIYRRRIEKAENKYNIKFSLTNGSSYIGLGCVFLSLSLIIWS